MPPTEPAAQPRRGGWLLLLGWLVVLAAAAAALWGNDERHLRTLGVMFVSITLEALPFVMLGALLGGLIEEFVSRERVTNLFVHRKHGAVFLAGLLGLVAPVCECAVIPVTRRLVSKGVPFHVAVAYLLAGPMVNPLVAASTWLAYGGQWSVVALRLGIGYVVAVTAALVMGWRFPGAAAVRPEVLAGHADDCGHDHGHEHHDHSHDHSPAPLGRRLQRALRLAANDFLLVGQFLVLGAFFAAVSQSYVERQAFVALASNPPAAIGLMMLLAVLLNLCSEADAFVAASFQKLLPLSAQMAFMVLGPMLDLKLLAMYLSFVRQRALVLLVTLMVVLVLVAMLILQAVWPTGGLS